MYFGGYKNFPDVTLNPKLLWEFNLDDFDYNEMRDVVVQRVIERGWPKDWYFILNKYGVAGVKLAIKNLAYLNDKDMGFVSHQFNIPLPLLNFDNVRMASLDDIAPDFFDFSAVWFSGGRSAY